MRTDGQLVERILHGDNAAFGELVDRYRHMAYGLAYHLTGEFEAARDLTQESFIQSYLKLDQLREHEKFAGWLRQIVVNVYRMQHRRKQIHTVALEEDTYTLPSPQVSDIDVVVRKALDKLREPDRLALTLHYIDGYSYTEIAGFLSVKPETVKTRLARVRKHLKKEITHMVEDTFHKKQLPDDFTEMTVSEAVRTLTEMLDEDVEPGMRMRIHNNLGCIYHDKMGDPNKGREHLKLAAETADAADERPMNFFHWRVYAWVSLRDHQWQEALSAALHIVDNAPTDFERRNLHVLMAAVKANLNQPEEVLHHLKLAATAGTEPPGADQWPFKVPTGTDPLEWVRTNKAEYFQNLMSDPWFLENMG